MHKTSMLNIQIADSEHVRAGNGSVHALNALDLVGPVELHLVRRDDRHDRRQHQDEGALNAKRANRSDLKAHRMA